LHPARQAGLLVVLAGSLSADSIPAALALEPDYVAVRGAACAGSRLSGVEEDRVRELTELVSRIVRQKADLQRAEFA
jgi:uncharacterized protein (UPF0264 family)